ncbi:hypothetical protein GCM10023092_23910 [Rurimicrobium arvi]|uniref:Uncharacterized protein n=1 Tax=Rurimicrobium arvi TaxID=2049916 RepID=A0ABP8MWL3_9BACT
MLKIKVGKYSILTLKTMFAVYAVDAGGKLTDSPEKQPDLLKLFKNLPIFVIPVSVRYRKSVHH